jgi:predicted nucleic acid-binding protein
VKPIADTGLLVGFLDSSDQFHDWAARCFGELRIAVTTCEAVIAETEYLVPSSGPLLMEMVRRGTLQLIPMLPDEADALEALMKRYPKMQFADACIVRLSETLSNAVVFTTDKRDFTVYRRHRNEIIKAVTP